jgi:hypothetical protein
MKAETIIEVVRKLIGGVDAIGETNHDNRAYENLNVMIDVCNALLDDIYIASKTKDCPQYSMKQIGGHAYRFIEDLKVWCDEVIGE